MSFKSIKGVEVDSAELQSALMVSGLGSITHLNQSKTPGVQLKWDGTTLWGELKNKQGKPIAFYAASANVKGGTLKFKDKDA